MAIEKRAVIQVHKVVKRSKHKKLEDKNDEIQSIKNNEHTPKEHNHSQNIRQKTKPSGMEEVSKIEIDSWRE